MKRVSIFVLCTAALLAAALAALAQTTGRISETESGVGGNGTSTDVVLSADGMSAAFISTADNLVADDTNAVADVFVRDTASGSIERVSVASDGTEAGGGSGSFEDIAISASGRFIAFTSAANNLTADDANPFEDVFVHDRQTGTTELVSWAPGGDPLDSNSSSPAISADGRFVAFLAETSSYAAVHDRDTDETRYLVNNFTPGTGTFQATDIDISDDGRYIAMATRQFNSNTSYVRFDRESPLGIWERVDPRVSGDSQSRLAWIRISGDGETVVFPSVDDNLVDDDGDGLVDVFVWNDGTLERVDADSFTGGEALEVRPDVSKDGRYVVFVPSVTQNPYSQNAAAYEVVRFDRNDDSVVTVSEFDDGDAISHHAKNPAISADGRFVGFDTAAALDADDSEGQTDVYVTDIEGTVEPPTPEECEPFDDVPDTNVFADDICWLAQQGITKGCNPPANSEFCPSDPVTRGQMAAFLVRALGYSDSGGGDLFGDDDGSVFEDDIDRLGTAGVTRGCNPPTNSEFCPSDPVTRQQMAAFLRRALDN